MDTPPRCDAGGVAGRGVAAGSVPGFVDARLAASAARQHGLVTRTQLTVAGLDSTAISYRVKIGRLHRVHRGVYAVGHTSSAPLTQAMAAVLACGDGAVLSHRSAAAVWDIGPWRGPIEVTTAANRRHRGVHVHRSRTLTEADVTVRFGIRVTSPARTLLDLADVLSDAALARAVNEAQVLRHVRLDEIDAILARSPGRRGAGRLRRFVELADAPTRSAFEDAFLAFVERFDLPRPDVNQLIAGYEADMLWRPQRLIVELDSRTFHDHPRSFERDREKDADLVAADLSVIRVTWRRLRDRPEREARRLRAVLARRTR